MTTCTLWLCRVRYQLSQKWPNLPIAKVPSRKSSMVTKEGRRARVSQLGSPRSIDIRLGIASKVRCFADEIKRERERKRCQSEKSDQIGRSHIRFRSDLVVGGRHRYLHHEEEGGGGGGRGKKEQHRTPSVPVPYHIYCTWPTIQGVACLSTQGTQFSLK